MSYILSILKLTLPYLNLLEYLLRNLDTNSEGIDDKAADGIREGVRLLTQFAAEDAAANPENLAKGLAGITAFGNSVLAALDQLATQPKSDDVIAQAEAQVASLSDPAKVYQAQRGNDAAALLEFKAKASSKLAAIKAV